MGRQDREDERKKKNSKRQSDEAKEKNKQMVEEKYKKSRYKNVPKSKMERKHLSTLLGEKVETFSNSAYNPDSIILEASALEVTSVKFARAAKENSHIFDNDDI
jgi:hypothetical protein